VHPIRDSIAAVTSREAGRMSLWFVVWVPLGFLIVVGVCNWMIRGEGPELDDWHLGFDAAVTTLTSALALMPDRLSDYHATATPALEVKARMANLSAFCAASFVVFMLVFAIHHEVARLTREGKCSAITKHWFKLGLANVLGLGSLVLFLLLIQ
jgi:hypothetical protein